MFNYRCPGCGKHHAVEKDFEQAFEAKCLRCAATISVTEELIHQSRLPARSSLSPSAMAEAIVRAPQSGAVGVASQAHSAAVAESEEPALESEEPTPKKKDRDNSKAKKEKDEKTRKKKSAKRAEDEDEDGEEEEEEEIVPERKPWSPPSKAPTKGKSGRPRWQFIAAVASVVLALGGAGGYLMFGGKKAEPKQTAKPKAAPKPTPKPTPKAVKKEEPPPPKMPETADLVLSAARLSAELAVNADIANAKYTGKLLDVSGLFLKLEKKDGLRPPPRQHAVFDTSGAPVSCDIEGGPTPFAAWSQLKPQQPFTVRAKYEQNGYLRECHLMPQYVSTADNRYKGKTIQVAGRIARTEIATNKQPYPSVVFEGETNSVLEVRCLFRTTDGQEVSKIQPGSSLTVQGECNGRQMEEGVSFVRLDNCELVYSSAAPRNIPRLEATRLLREYEEDERKDYLPLPGEEERIEKEWTVRAVFKEWTSDPKAFARKYGNRILRVRGKEQKRGNRALVLTSGDTDLAFGIECHFDSTAYEAVNLRREPEFRIRGLFVGQIDNRGLRLENCKLDMPRANGPLVTTDYLPHKEGRTFAVDVVNFDVPVGRKLVNLVQREVHAQRREGATELVVIQKGPLVGKSLFDEGIQEKWSQQTKARIKNPSTNGIYYQRKKAGFIELGTPFIAAEGKPDIAWIPVLKLGVRAGEKWKWEPPSGLHEYEVEKFDERNGTPCVLLREFVTMSTDILHPIEILHVYAKGLGEVERRQWRQLDQNGAKVLLSEMKWVDKPISSGSPSDNPLSTPKPPSRSLDAPTKK